MFTVDHSANHPNGRVPVLDVELWREKIPDPDIPGATKEKIRYSYFEKEVANPKVMDRESVIPHRMMMSSMTQECVRRLHNMSRDLPDQDKCVVLSAFMRKLQKSGYSLALRCEILQAGVRTFRNKIIAEELGIRPFHRLRGHNIAERRRAKVSAKEDWFKPNPGAWKTRLANLDKEKRKETIAKVQAQDNNLPLDPDNNQGTRSGHKPSRVTPRATGSNPTVTGPKVKQPEPHAENYGPKTTTKSKSCYATAS